MDYAAVQVVGTARMNDGETTSTTANTPCVVPSSAQDGDVGIFICLANAGTTAVFTPATGWTALRAADNNSGNNQQVQVFGRDMLTADAGTTTLWTTSVGTRFIGLMLLLRGALPVANVIVGAPTVSNAASTTATEGTVTSTSPFSAILGLYTMRFGTAAPSGTISTYAASETFDDRTVTAFTASPNYTLEAAHLTVPVASVGSQGGASNTISASATNQVNYALAIAPALTQPQPLNRARFRAANW